MKLEISEGEILDRLSILEIKKNEITDEERLKQVNAELSSYTCVKQLKRQYHTYYELLYYVNKLIWDLTNKIKSLNELNSEYAEVAYNIFEANQARFRIKNIINNLCDSSTKEQKSYTKCIYRSKIIDEDLDKVIVKLICATLKYDQIEVSCNNKQFLSILPHVNVVDGIDQVEPIEADEGLKRLYETKIKPITYLAGGALGDFFHSLSVVKEKYVETGRTGVIYLTEPFTFGVERSYNDLKQTVLSQEYIKDFQIYVDQPYEVNLNAWRCPLLYKNNWYTIYNKTYNVEWGRNKWITAQLPLIEELKGKICVSHSLIRWNPRVDYKKFLGQYDQSKIVFVAFQPKEYENFSRLTMTNYPFYHCPSIDQMVSAIDSCDLFIGNLSSPLAIAFSLHKRCVGILDLGLDGNHSIRLNEHLPFFSYIR